MDQAQSKTQGGKGTLLLQMFSTINWVELGWVDLLNVFCELSEEKLSPRSIRFTPKQFSYVDKNSKTTLHKSPNVFF